MYNFKVGLSTKWVRLVDKQTNLALLTGDFGCVTMVLEINFLKILRSSANERGYK